MLAPHRAASGTERAVVSRIKLLPEDRGIIEQCVKDLAKLCPEPKWKLVVEVSGNAPDFSGKVARAMSDHDPLEKRIATLLGEHMPLSDLTSGVPPTDAEKKRLDELLKG